MMVGCYLLLSAGIQLHVHYCCGEVSDVHLSAEQSCNHGADDDHNCCKKGSCCSYIHLDLTIDDSHQPSETASFTPVDCISPTIEHERLQVFSTSAYTLLRCEDASPPIAKRFLLFHSMILYA
jgi:hypothetical protein